MQKTRALQIYVKILNKFEIIPIDRSAGHKPSKDGDKEGI